jgi:hypothetical protein
VGAHPTRITSLGKLRVQTTRLVTLLTDLKYIEVMTGTSEDHVQVSINSLRSYGCTLQQPTLSAEWNKRAGPLITNLSELQRTLEPDATEGILEQIKTSCEHLSKWEKSQDERE